MTSVAWLLVIMVSANNTITVPDIATEIDCNELAARFAPSASSPVPPHRCLDYRTIRGYRTSRITPDD